MLESLLNRRLDISNDLSVLFHCEVILHSLTPSLSSLEYSI
jgi:hypothetical protein